MRTLFLLFLTVVISTVVNAQSMSNSVIGSTGGSFSAANFSANFTAGEVIIATANTSSIILTQGFHQPQVNTGSTKQLAFSAGYNLFPNPSSKLLEISSKFKNSDNSSLKIFDNCGKLVFCVEFANNIGIKLNVSEWSNGLYSVQIISKNEMVSATFSKL